MTTEEQNQGLKMTMEELKTHIDKCGEAIGDWLDRFNDHGDRDWHNFCVSRILWESEMIKGYLAKLEEMT